MYIISLDTCYNIKNRNNKFNYLFSTKISKNLN